MNKPAVMVALAAVGAEAQAEAKELAALAHPVVAGEAVPSCPVTAAVAPVVTVDRATASNSNNSKAKAAMVSNNSNKRPEVTLGMSGFTMLPARSTRPSSTPCPNT